MKRNWRLGLILIGLLSAIFVIVIGIVSAAHGTDWEGEIYDCIDFSCSIEATVIYANGLDFRWTDKPEDDNGDEISSVSRNNFSAKFRTDETFENATYEFRVRSTDGVRVFIDGDRVLDKWENRSETTNTFTQDMESRSYRLKVEFYNDSGDAVLEVEWFRLNDDGSVSGDNSPTAIPPTPIPPALASVVNVNGLSLRTGPYLGASLINVLRPGNTYTVSAKNNGEGLFTWYFVHTESGLSGWASGRYLALTVDDNTIPEVGTVFDTLGGGSTGIIAVPRSVMNVRVRPSARTGRITQMPWGGEAELLARTVQGGKDFWYLVRYGDVVGWIYAPFVGVRGDINNIPVY